MKAEKKSLKRKLEKEKKTEKEEKLPPQVRYSDEPAPKKVGCQHNLFRLTKSTETDIFKRNFSFFF